MAIAAKHLDEPNDLHDDSAPAVSDWDVYRRSLAAPSGPLPPFQVARINSFWRLISQKVSALPPPQAGVAPDGTFAMTWDRNGSHFEIEIFPSGLYDWFYWNKNTGAKAGEEDLPLGGVFSASMLEHLGQAVAG